MADFGCNLLQKIAVYRRWWLINPSLEMVPTHQLADAVQWPIMRKVDEESLFAHLFALIDGGSYTRGVGASVLASSLV